MVRMHEPLIARHLCNLQPFPIRTRILHEKSFGEKFRLTAQTVMNAANFGPIDQRDFIIAARKAFIKGKAQRFRCLDGTRILIAPHQHGVLLKKYSGKKVADEILLGEMLILSTDPEKRNRAVDKMLNRIGPTAPDFSALQTASMDRELSDTEVTALLTESATGLTAFMERLIHALKIHEVTLDYIIPDSLDYYERFCGPAPADSDPEKYLCTVLPVYRKDLLRRDFTKGLDICLLGALRDDLSPGQWTGHVPADDLWNSLVACDPRRDPISLLGALDIALYRQDDARFNRFAEEAVSKLVQDVFPRPDDIDSYKLLPLIAELTLNRINTIENSCLRAPFWKRMCAWMQALFIARMTLPYNLNFESFSEWVNDQRTLAGYYAKILDLRREPMYGSAEMTPVSFRSEIVGRLALLRSRHTAEGRMFPRTDEIEKAVSKISLSAYPWSCALPGPLEGHHRPVENKFRIIPSDVSVEIRKKLKESHEDTLLSHLAHLSQWFWFEEDLLESVRNVIEKIVLRGINEHEFEQRIRRLSDVGLIAAVHRDAKLAKVIGNIVVDAAQEAQSAVQVMVIINALLVAAAAFENNADWAAWLEEQLKKVAENIPHGETAKAFLQSLEELKKVINLRLGIHARAEALASSAT
jgi:hypothetical protein